MAWLSQQGISFESRDITANEAWLDELVELNARATPCTVIDWPGRREVVMGFDPERLEALLCP